MPIPEVFAAAAPQARIPLVATAPEAGLAATTFSACNRKHASIFWTNIDAARHHFGRTKSRFGTPCTSVKPMNAWQEDQQAAAESKAMFGTSAKLMAAMATSGIAMLRRRWRNSSSRGGRRPAMASAVTSTSTLPLTLTQAPLRATDPVALFTSLRQRTSNVARTIDSLPQWLPMLLLSTYTVVPVFSILAAALCPSPAKLTQGLAASLGCLLGTAAGAFLERAKKEAAHCAVLRLLQNHVRGTMAAEELQALIDGSRRRFRVSAGKPSGDAFEDDALRGTYQNLLLEMLDGPEHDPQDLPTLQRVKAALDLDGIVVGCAHWRASQVLSSKGYSGLDGEDIRVPVDKLLFLSERAFSDEEPEEARLFEMRRLRQVLKISDQDARERIATVSRALYQQDLSAVVNQVDAHTADALAGASQAFGLAGEEAVRMNTETYRQIARNLLTNGMMEPPGKEVLKRAQVVLQLGDNAATQAFADVASPILRIDVDSIAQSLRDESAKTSQETLAEAANTLAKRQRELNLLPIFAVNVAAEGFLATMRSLYESACKQARREGDNTVLSTLDKLISLSCALDKILAGLQSELPESQLLIPSLTMAADQAAARRLYGLYLERDLANAAEGAPPPSELARILEVSGSDEEAARIEVCQPHLHKLFSDSIEQSKADGGKNLAKIKSEVFSKASTFKLPTETMDETAMDVYKMCLSKVSNRVLKAPEKEFLDNCRSFLDLDASDVTLFHLRAFGKIYEESVEEAMGRGGIMSSEAMEALDQLRERLGLSEVNAQRIFFGVVEKRLKQMMGSVQEAWEEATYSKEALAQIYKERGKDFGDDPSADGSGGELGIRESVPLEGIRGQKLMNELTKVADFYTGNQVYAEGKTFEDAYPITVGKYMEDKTKEEIYGIFAWNAVTCQDTASRDTWTRVKPHVGGILGLSEADCEKVLCRMVSRWCNMFIKQKMQDQGKLSDEDINTLTEWVPTFFGINKDMTKEMVQGVNKNMLQGKVLKLLNKPQVTPEDVQKLREEVENWDLSIQKDLELTRPQLRSLFRVEVIAALEDPDLSSVQKHDIVSGSQEGFGLGEEEAADELKDLINSKCQGYLVNAVADLLQGNESLAVCEMQRLELLAAFAEDTEGLEVNADWEVAPAMRERLLKTYEASAVGKQTTKPPDVKLLGEVLGV